MQKTPQGAPDWAVRKTICILLSYSFLILGPERKKVEAGWWQQASQQHIPHQLLSRRGYELGGSHISIVRLVGTLARTGLRMIGNEDSMGRLSADNSWGVWLPFPAWIQEPRVGSVHSQPNKNELFGCPIVSTVISIISQKKNGL